MDCIFCKIAKGQVPCYKIYEDEEFIAFLDIFPFTKGHTLIIPKEHYRWIWDIPEAGKIMEIAKKIAESINENLNPEFIQTLSIGLDVPHAHLHIVPRYKDDGHPGSVDPKNTMKLSESELKEISEEIKI